MRYPTCEICAPEVTCRGPKPEDKCTYKRYATLEGEERPVWCPIGQCLVNLAVRAMANGGLPKRSFEHFKEREMRRLRGENNLIEP